MKVNITPVMMMAWAGRTSRRANVPGELGGSELGGTGCGAEEASDVLMGNLTFAPADGRRGAARMGKRSVPARHAPAPYYGYPVPTAAASAPAVAPSTGV